MPKRSRIPPLQLLPFLLPFLLLVLAETFSTTAFSVEEKDGEIRVTDGDLNVGIKQTIPNKEEEYDKHLEVVELIHEMNSYLREEMLSNPEKYDEEQISQCTNQHELCAFWATLGECDANPGYMKENCVLACFRCHYGDDPHYYEEGEEGGRRCPLDPDAVDIIGPGDLDRLFEKVSNSDEGSEYAKYRPTVLSRPSHPDNNNNNDSASYQIGPWVVVYDNFLTDEECDRLIELGYEGGFIRSHDVGELMEDGTYESVESDHRTSQNAWCDGGCMEDEVGKRVMEKIANLTGFPESHSEHLQLLKYEVGQYYKEHHDYTPPDLQPGPRVLTLFLYLNDVEEGGGTHFPKLKEPLTVIPRKGRALLWPSVLDEDPNEQDLRTNHAALKVEKGVKYGANAWLHLRDFKGPFEIGCHNVH